MPGSGGKGKISKTAKYKVTKRPVAVKEAYHRRRCHHHHRHLGRRHHHHHPGHHRRRHHHHRRRHHCQLRIRISVVFVHTLGLTFDLLKKNT